jgi:hypothetical protein
MSDTPRTLWAIEEYRRYGGSPQNEPVFSSDMSDLENELNAANAKCNVLMDELAKAKKQRDVMETALKEIYNVSVFDYDTMPEEARRKYREVVLSIADKALAELKGTSI